MVNNLFLSNRNLLPLDGYRLVKGNVAYYIVEKWTGSFGGPPDLDSYPYYITKVEFNDINIINIEEYFGRALNLHVWKPEQKAKLVDILDTGYKTSRVAKVFFKYDANNRLDKRVSIIESDGKIEREHDIQYKYDEMGRRDSNVGSGIKYIYNSIGLLIKIITRDIESNLYSREALHYYDSLNRLIGSIVYGYYKDDDGEDINIEQGLKEIFNIHITYEDLADRKSKRTERSLGIQHAETRVRIDLFDRYGNLIEQQSYMEESRFVTSRQLDYDYDKFGNWTEVKSYIIADGHRQLETVSKRKIVYKDMVMPKFKLSQWWRRKFIINRDHYRSKSNSRNVIELYKYVIIHQTEDGDWWQPYGSEHILSLLYEFSSQDWKLLKEDLIHWKMNQLEILAYALHETFIYKFEDPKAMLDERSQLFSHIFIIADNDIKSSMVEDIEFALEGSPKPIILLIQIKENLEALEEENTTYRFNNLTAFRSRLYKEIMIAQY